MRVYVCIHVHKTVGILILIPPPLPVPPALSHPVCTSAKAMIKVTASWETMTWKRPNLRPTTSPNLSLEDNQPFAFSYAYFCELHYKLCGGCLCTACKCAAYVSGASGCKWDIRGPGSDLNGGGQVVQALTLSMVQLELGIVLWGFAGCKARLFQETKVLQQTLHPLPSAPYEPLNLIPINCPHYQTGQSVTNLMHFSDVISGVGALLARHFLLSSYMTLSMRNMVCVVKEHMVEEGCAPVLSVTQWQDSWVNLHPNTCIICFA